MKTLSFFIVLSCLLVTPAAALQINESAPPFALRDSTGKNFFFSDYIGPKKKTAAKGMILGFFASWCEPCRRELPVLNSVVDEFEKMGIKVVLVGIKEDSDRISAMLDELKVDKPIVLSDPYGKTGQKYGVIGLPRTYFIGADGKLKDIVIGEITDIKVLREKAGKLLQ